MTVAYKYISSKYVGDFLSGRKIKIGTLHNFRKEEQHGSEIGDPGEGIRQIYDVIDYAHSEKPETITPLVEKIDPLFRSRPNSVIRNVLVQDTEDCADQYVFCTTYEFDLSTMQQMGYDCCVIITNVERFLELIRNKLVAKGLISGKISHGKCIYGDRRTYARHPNPPPPWALKLTKHEHQKEYRMVWEPSYTLIDDIYLKCISVREFLTIYPTK
ncbi:MAG: hypothetical protein BMS9Abin06_0405 [Gammaproteobacteria bacterium]|nr:MAG: hypothetical protein BMS9Abin06_0405 [Gammaproteobacteria bacterium]